MQDVSATLSSIVQRESVRASETLKYADSDIKLARAKNDLYILQLLSLPVSVFIESTKGDKTCEICVVFDQTRPLITKKKNAFSTLTAA